MEISVYIIAYNEAEKIRDCINTVLWADEIIVIDSNSTDRTSEIAESLGAKVIHIPFNVFG
jgi:glycosyltransferase involved in cell wall biosynthesis